MRRVLGLALLLILGVPAPAYAGLVDDAGRAGIRTVDESFSANPHDYDSDGDEDVLIVYHDQGAILWRNQGGTFTRAHTFPEFGADGGRVDRHDCAWGDVNRDGRDDVYCTVGRGLVNAVKVGSVPDNELWIRKADGSFVDRGTEWGVGDPYGRGRDATFIDANGDRWPDLFVGNEIPRDGDNQGAPNRLFLNQGGTGFAPAPGYGLNKEVDANCAQAADLNGDGEDDLLTCGQYGVRIFRHRDGGYTDVTVASGFPSFVEDGIVKTSYFTEADLIDMDKDRDLDFVGIRGDAMVVKLNNGRGVFSTSDVEPILNGRQVATGDADGDGDTDVYVLRAGDNGNPDDVLFLKRPGGFARVEGPPTGGFADTVEPIDYDFDRAVEFIVLNGYDAPGPVQLLDWS